MTTKRITWTDANGMVRVTTPDQKSMKALTGSGGMLSSNSITKQAAAYVAAGMSETSARKFAEGYAFGGLTKTEALDLIWERTQAVYVERGVTPINTITIEERELPYFGSFGRGAWRQDGAKAPVFDMARARLIKTDQIRMDRGLRLSVLDVDYIRADETGNDGEKQRTASLKQKLRDMPDTIQPDLDAIDMPEDLEKWEPPWP